MPQARKAIRERPEPRAQPARLVLPEIRGQPVKQVQQVLWVPQVQKEIPVQPELQGQQVP